MYRFVSRWAYCKLWRDFGFFCPVNHFSEGGVNANHNVARSPSSAENDFRLFKNSEGNRDGEWNFCWRKEADVALFLQVTRIKKMRKICEANLTSRLLPETGRSESKETLVVYHLPQILGNSCWNVNGNNLKRFFGLSHWKIPSWYVPNGNSFTIYKFLVSTSFML